MDYLKKYQNKNVAIYGMGKTGRSAAKAFKRLKAKVVCWDDNANIRREIIKLNYSIGKFWKNKNLIDTIVISPGIDIKIVK